ncbi:MAG: PAS domain S-box protein, partial [Bacteroidota bacterium]
MNEIQRLRERIASLEQQCLELRRENDRLISERVHDRASKARRDLIEFTIDNVGDGIIWLDKSGNIFFVNEIVCKELGYDRLELIRMTIFDLDKNLTKNEWEKNWAIVNDLKKITYQASHSTKDHGEIPVEINLNYIKYGEQQFTCAVIRYIADQKRIQSELRASLRQFKTLAQIAPIGIFKFNLEGENLFINERGSTLLGMTAKRSLGVGWRSNLHEEDKDAVMARWLGAVKSLEPFKMEFRVSTGKDKVVWLSCEAIPEFSDDNKVIGYIGTFADITVHKEVQQVIADREKMVRLVMDNVPAFMLYADKDYNYQFTNEALRKFLNKSLEEIEGTRIPDVIGEMAFEKIRPRLEKVLEGEHVHFEDVISPKAGKTKYLTVDYIPHTVGGEVVGFFGCIFDNSERIIAEQALRQSEERVRLIMDNVPASLVYVDNDERYLFANDFYKKFVKREGEDIVGLKVEEVLGPEGYKGIKPNIDQVLQGKTGAYEAKIPVADGDNRYIYVNYAPYWVNGEVTGFFACINDITEQKQVEEALRISESQIRIIIESVPANLVFIDNRGFYKYANRNYKKLIGHENEEIAGRKVVDVIGKDAFDKIRPLMKDALKGKAGSFEGVIHLGTSESGAPYVNVNYAPHIVEGEVVGFFASIIDISDRRRMEEALRESENKLRLVTDSLPVGLVFVNKDKQYEYANTPYKELNGFPPDQSIEGVKVEDFLTKETYKKIKGRVEDGLKGNSGTYETVFQLKNGTRRNVNVIYTPYIENEVVEGYFACVADITDLKKAEVALKESEEKIIQLIDSVPVGLIYVDKDIRFQYANNPYKNIFAIPFDEDVSGRKKAEVVGEHNFLKSKDRIEEVLKGNNVKFEFQIQPRKGEPRDVTVSYIPHIVEQEVRGYFASIVDITERKKGEDSLKQAFGELEDANMRIKEAQTQLVQSEKMASLGLLTAGIAHEINNPINFIYAGINSLDSHIADIRKILGAYSLVTPENVEEKLQDVEELKEEMEFERLLKYFKKTVNNIQDGAERTAEIVKGLRIFSRTDDDKFQLADIHKNIEASLITLRGEYKNRVKMIQEFGDLPMIECYPGKLNQVFSNILINAIQAIPGEGEIVIKTEMVKQEKPPRVKVSIRDNGVGIPKETQQKIFEPFFTTKEVGKGTGLGMSITYSIIQKHGGQIELTSSDLPGESF